MAGDDSAQARFWPMKDIPRLAFRSNRRALGAYIQSKKDYWAVVDSIEKPSDQSSEQAVNELSRRLINVLIRNKDLIILRWLEDVTSNPSTAEYHQYEEKKLAGICDKIISQITLWLGHVYDTPRIRNFYTKLGQERRREGVRISVSLSALSLIRKHIWDVALDRGSLQRNLDLYMTFEMQRRITIFFDLATYYLTQGYEEI